MQSAKTSARGWGTATRPGTRTLPLLPTPPAPAGLAIEDATQSLTARARTEALLRHPRPKREENVAARPLARLPGKIFRICSGALALARLARLQLRSRCGFPSHLLFDAVQHLFPARRPLLPLPFAVAARLLLPILLARFTTPVGPRASPPPPTPGLLPALGTAIPLLRVMRMERLFTPLEQAAPLAIRRTTVLSPTRRGPILRQAHGSGKLPGLSLAAEIVLRCEAFL